MVYRNFLILNIVVQLTLKIDLFLTEGSGIYQEEGKPAQVIKKGDVVNIPENVKHWHGASADTKMVHIAITNFKGDTQVTWLEPVSDEQYSEVN